MISNKSVWWVVQEEGHVTLRLMTDKPARIINPGSVFSILRNLLQRDITTIGRIRMLQDQPEGNGAFERPPPPLLPCHRPLLLLHGQWTERYVLS